MAKFPNASASQSGRDCKGRCRPHARRSLLPALSLLLGLATLAVLAGCETATTPEPTAPPPPSVSGLTAYEQGFIVSVGTWNWKDQDSGDHALRPGSAFLAGFRFVPSSPTPVTVSFAGQGSWNDAEPVVIALNAGGTYLYDVWNYSFSTFELPPKTMPLEVAIQDDGTTLYELSVEQDPGVVMGTTEIDVTEGLTDHVKASWTAVDGAVFYRATLAGLDAEGACATYIASDDVTDPAVTLAGLTLVAGTKYCLTVAALPFAEPMGTTAGQDVAVPPTGFNVSTTQRTFEAQAPLTAP